MEARSFCSSVLKELAQKIVSWLRDHSEALAQFHPTRDSFDWSAMYDTQNREQLSLLAASPETLPSHAVLGPYSHGPP